FASALARRMREETATDFFEWIEHLALPITEENGLKHAGFALAKEAETQNGAPVYEHPRATLPRIILHKQKEESVVALRPEHLADFIARNNLSGEPKGEPFSRYRSFVVSEENGTRLEAVERLGYRGFMQAPLKPGQLDRIIKARELFQTRPRLVED